MTSEDPFTATLIGSIGAVGSAVSGLVSAFSKPSEPKPPAPSPQATQGTRRRAAAAQGRSSTILTGQKLGSVGQV